MNHKQIRKLIHSTLKELGHKYAHKNAVNLLFWTGYVESKYQYLYQLGDGPARSFWQVEPMTCVDAVSNYFKFRKSLREQCSLASMTDPRLWKSTDPRLWEWALEHNMAVAIIMARIKYWRSPMPLPINKDEAASMWKLVYNSSKGKGTVAKFKSLISNIDI